MVDNVSPWSQTSPIQNSPAMVEPEQIPYYWLPGSPEPSAQEQSDLSISNDPVGDTVDKLFPFYDGVDDIAPSTIAQPPAGMSTDPDQLDPNDFLSWHSMFQLQYIDEQGSGTPKSVLIGPSTGTQITAVVLKEGTMVGIVDQMQKTDFAKLSKADQEAVAAMPVFTATDGVAARLGLLPVDGATVTVGTTSMQADTVSEARAAMIALCTATKNTMVAGSPLFVQADVDVFKAEVDNLIGRINSAGIFSQTEIEKTLREISTRYKRAEAFGTVPSATVYYDYVNGSNNNDYNVTTGYYKGLVSLDDNAGITLAYKKFMEQEKKLLSLDNSKLAVVGDGMLENKKLDVPNLVFLLQLNYNLVAEAKVTADTEEINQQNVLLQIYGQMQQLVNGVSKTFGTDQEETRNIFGSDDVQEIDDTSPDATTMKVISMFEDWFATNLGAGLVKHPIEELRGITRPLQDMVRQSNSDGNNEQDEINEFRKTQWDSFNTQLSDTVTLINQENQIKMNDINSMNKQKDRHFDLANGALSKMFDTIQNISRAMGS